MLLCGAQARADTLASRVEDLLDQKASLERAVAPILEDYCALTSRLSLSDLEVTSSPLLVTATMWPICTPGHGFLQHCPHVRACMPATHAGQS